MSVVPLKVLEINPDQWDQLEKEQRAILSKKANVGWMYAFTIYVIKDQGSSIYESQIRYEQVYWQPDRIGFGYVYHGGIDWFHQCTAYIPGQIFKINRRPKYFQK